MNEKKRYSHFQKTVSSHSCEAINFNVFLVSESKKESAINVKIRL